MTKYKPNDNTGILTKLLLCKMAFKSKLNQVLDNLYNAFFRLFNAQISAKDPISSPGTYPARKIELSLVLPFTPSYWLFSISDSLYDLVDTILY